MGNCCYRYEWEYLPVKSISDKRLKKRSNSFFKERVTYYIPEDQDIKEYRKETHVHWKEIH